MPPDDERAFFDPIRDAAADDGPRLIFADWLDEHGQFDRADLIRLQCALDRLPEDDPRRDELRERERKIFDANEATSTAALRPLVTGWAFHRGVIDSVSVTANQFLANGSAIFELAPIRKVRFIDIGEQFCDLMQSPLLQFVRELDLSGAALGDEGLKLLARSSHLARLDALDLGFTDLGLVGLEILANTPALSGLRSLKINDNPNLSPLGLRALGFSPHLAALTELDLSGNGLPDAILRPLLDGPVASRLNRLLLQGNHLADEGTTHFVQSSVFARMAERDGVIDLRSVEMGPAGARSLAECAVLRHVHTLNLEGNVIGDAGLTALAGSPHLVMLRALLLRDNRIGGDGPLALARSPLMATIRVLDLTENIVTVDNQDRLNEASTQYDWRGPLHLKVDSQVRSRPPNLGPGGFRRPMS